MKQRFSYIFTRRWILFLILVSCFTWQEGWAQKKKKNSIEVGYGDEYFKNGDYYKAVQYYATAYEKQPNSSYLNYKIAECNRLMFNYPKAEDFYGRTIKNTSNSSEYPLASYWYALMQKTNGKYDEAITSFDQFIATFQPKNKEEEDYVAQAKVEKEGCQFAVEELKHPIRDHEFYALPAPVNTKFSDYSPAIFHHDSSIVLTSARENNTGGDIYDATGESFSDNIRFEKNKEGTWVASDNKDGFKETVNTQHNDGAGIFTQDKKKFYFTQCNDDQGECAIFVTRLMGGRWSVPVKLNSHINDPGGWNAQPSLNSKGDTLYFVSKRKGGLGQHDIWYSVSPHGEDHWETPVNLGPKVNTAFIDMAPSFYTNEHTLFFSSTGHKGFGGLDIFMAKGDSLQKVTNLGLPFNSNRDDFYFVLGDQKGFMTSNREGGSGNDDIYVFNIASKKSILALINGDSLSPLAESVSVRGKVLDASTNEGVPNLENVLVDEAGLVLKTSKTNKEGGFRYDNLEKDKNYMVLLKEDNPKVTNKSNYKVVDVKITGSTAKVSRSLFENIYFDFNKSDLRPEAMKVLDELADYSLKNPNTQIELAANTDNYGTNDYNIALSKSRGDAAMEYLVSKNVDRSSLVVKARGEGKPIAANDNEIGRQLNRRVEFYILGGGDNVKASGMVYILQPQNTLYSLAKENGMTVEELKAFNGLQGEDIKAYSPIRVPRRGDAALVAPVTMSSAHDINSNSSYVGTFAEDNKNIVLKEGEELYTVQPGNTLFSIAKEFNMGVEELKTMNKLSNNGVVVGQKIKVKKKQ
jgi:outer membrane protein OmpA-like peptidoglycan-associated protein/LysM repeat protein/tetratricopeptide (TPR) repeat protein